MNCTGALISQINQSQFSAYDYDADMVWNTQRSENFVVNNFLQTKTWIESFSGNLGLYPPLRNNATSLDFEKAPLLETTADQKVYLNFKDQKHLRSLNENLTSLLSERYSVGFFINSVDVSAATNNFTRVFDLISPNGFSDGYVGVDVTSTQVKVFYWFGQESQHWLLYDIAAEDLQNGLAVLVRLGPDYESLGLSVNGKMAQKSYTSTVPPPRIAYVSRQLRINTEFTNSTGFHLYEIAIWLSSLSDQTLKDYSQAYYNSYVLGLSGAISGGPKKDTIDDGFSQVLTVLNKARASGSCVSCHGAITQKSGFLGAKSSNVSWVKPGMASDSLVIKALRHQSGAKVMPPTGSQLPANEIKIIEDWINSLTISP